MRDAGDITLSRGIVHIVDHNRKDPVLSEVELDLGAQVKLVNYFKAQVRNALGDANAGAAVFRGEGTGARDLCRAALADGRQFVALSQDLARLLFRAMGTDLRISAGSLAVCLYSGSAYPDEAFLALLKIDPSEMLVQRVRQLEQGRQVTFDVIDDVMPAARERLQKAALVRGPGKGGFDLLLLDRQTEKMAASFFAVGFLGAEPKLDDDGHTKAVYYGLYAAYDRMTRTGVLDASQGEQFRDEIESVVRGRSFNRDEWLQKLRLPERAPEIVAQELKKKVGEDREFALSTAVAERLTEKRRLRGDFGLLLEVDAAHYDDVVVDEQSLEGGKVLRLTVEVRNPQWAAKGARYAARSAGSQEVA